MNNSYINKIEDNCREQNAKRFERNKVNELLFFGNRTIASLSKEDNNLLFFSNCIDEDRNLLNEGKIFEYYEKDNSVYISTNNIVGFIGKNDQFIKICSRFDIDNDNDFLLQYMLEKVYSINLLTYKFKNSHDAILDMLMMLFPIYLKAAISQGIYREYITKKYNNGDIKGTIDIARHIKNNIPFSGKIAYTTRMYSSDNDVFHLIRHTIEYIKTKEIGKRLLNSNNEIRECVKKVELYTPDYNKYEKHNIIYRNVRKLVRQPYYLRYKELQNLCIKILRFDEIMYGNGDDKSYGVIIDIAWLWEQYVGILLKKIGIIHFDNRAENQGFKLFNSGRRMIIPDFYKEGICILDAKYKRYETGSIRREDLYQIITYMYRLKIKKGVFIVPARDERDTPVLDDDLIRDRSFMLHKDSYGGDISVKCIYIPQKATDYDEFIVKMKENEESLINEINEVCNV